MIIVARNAKISARAITPPLVCLPVWVFVTFPSSAEDKESGELSSSKASTSFSKISNNSRVEVVDFSVDTTTTDEEMDELDVDEERVVVVGANDVVFFVVVDVEVVEVEVVEAEVVDTGKTDGNNPFPSLSASHWA